jgi:uncharacterized Zn-finger protein
MVNKKLSINYILDVKPFKCSWKGCNKSYAHSQSLIVHVRTHTGERPYHCSECLRSFTSKSGLNRHNYIHSGERPFKCEFGTCTSRFYTKNKLEIHQRIHYNIKPYSCCLCKYSCRDVRDTILYFLYFFIN